MTGSGLSDFVIDTSALRFTAVVAVALLFAVLDSFVVVVADAVFEMLVADVAGLTRARIRTTFCALAAIVPRDKGLLHALPAAGSHGGTAPSMQYVAVAPSSSLGSASASETEAAGEGLHYSR